MRDREEIFLDGAWVEATGEALVVTSPHTEQPVARVLAASATDVDRAVAAARRAFDTGPWPRLTLHERVSAVRRLIDIYDDHRVEMAELISVEMGAPITFAQRAHVGLPWAMMGALCDLAERHVWQERRDGAFGGQLLLRKSPLGVVAAIVPWNMPQVMITTKLVPALLAGCAVVVKPAQETPLDALLLAELVAEAQFPPGVVNILPAGRDVGEYLVGHPGIDKVSFTGSTAAGRRVAAACADNLTRVTLELGGKSAAIVLDDADPAAVSAGVRMASLSNSGQLCNALTRILVPAHRAEEFTDALVETVSALPVGDPQDASTALGPLATCQQQQRVWGHIDAGIHEGARLVTGGPGRPDGISSGWYVRPTVFADVDNSMTIAREEIFGPVLAVMTYADEAEAIRLANNSPYGLAGSVWTADVERGLALVDHVRTGTFGVNQGYSLDPAAPFGGVKGSGYGRELGREGLDSFLDVKSISVAASAESSSAATTRGSRGLRVR